jgi:pimeloyl-ACP methyl ester carboxylesterase
MALVDVELRTAVASVVTAAAMPSTLLRGGDDHRQAAEFYSELGRENDVDGLFPAPPAGVAVRNRTVARLRWAPSVTDVETLSFISPYEVAWPAARARFEAHSRNAIGRAMHWRHEDGPRPTILFVHGFTGSPHRLNSLFFQLPWYYRHGCDVVLAVLPFHGRRNDLGGLFDGSGLFTDGLATFSEAMMQSVTDLRVLVDYLEGTGVERIGITGLSLGGYVTALMAAVEPRLHFAAPNCPVTDMGTLLERWFPAGTMIRAGLRLAGVERETHVEALRLHSPLRFPARVDQERLFIIGGRADRLSPPEQVARLWHHWGRPRMHWFPGSHILHLRRAVYLREMGRFLRDTQFSAG